MKLSPQAIADLALLSQAVNDPDVDLLDTLGRFVADVISAVPSYLGMSLSMGTADAPIDITVMADHAEPGAIGSSLLIPAPALFPGTADRGERHETGLVIYAGASGALVDLAADLGWLSDLPRHWFVLDAHLTGRAPAVDSMSAVSLVNQALGVMLGRGLTPEQPEADITARATTAGISKLAVVEAILAEVSATEHRTEPRAP